MLRKIKGTFENVSRKSNSDLETNKELKNPSITYETYEFSLLNHKDPKCLFEKFRNLNYCQVSVSNFFFSRLFFTFSLAL